MSAYQRDVQELKRVLIAATEVRHLRQGFEDGELGWVRHERSVMHDAVNTMRARYGKPPVNEDVILRAETLSSGHIDYVQKFALGCADIVHAPTPDNEGETNG